MKFNLSFKIIFIFLILETYILSKSRDVINDY
jgi:hypothetical protein